MDFDLSIDPNPRFVSVVRRFVEETLERVVCDPETVFRVAMTAHELLENASKYSSGAKSLLRVSLKRSDAESGNVSLCLINETTPAHIGRLRERIDAINAARDPFELYQQMMRDSSRLTDESGLGLARISAEAEMSLGLEVKGSTVAIVASARVSMTGATT
jgi:two-component sensor histidine kinase